MGKYEKWACNPKLKITKRRFTIKEVINIIQIGRPTVISGSAANWDDPA
jgi:AICAR transformylase/IMP cyclohydrolase PurH